MQQKATTACASSATERAAKHRSERNGASMQGYSHSPTSFCIQHPQPCSQHCAQLTSKALAPPAAPCREMTRNCAACVELSDVLDVPTPYSDVCAVHYAETDWLSVVFVPRCSPSIDRELTGSAWCWSLCYSSHRQSTVGEAPPPFPPAACVCSVLCCKPCTSRPALCSDAFVCGCAGAESEHPSLLLVVDAAARRMLQSAKL
eukprot:378272-Rhodomonas_salina.1